MHGVEYRMPKSNLQQNLYIPVYDSLLSEWSGCRPPKVHPLVFVDWKLSEGTVVQSLI